MKSGVFPIRTFSEGRKLVRNDKRRGHALACSQKEDRLRAIREITLLLYPWSVSRCAGFGGCVIYDSLSVMTSLCQPIGGGQSRPCTACEWFDTSTAQTILTSIIGYLYQ